MEVVVGPLNAIPQNGMVEYTFDGICILICRSGDKLTAVGGICPHRGAQLSQGVYTGASVVCPWHNWEFDMTTGKGITNPMSALPTYKTTIMNGDIVLTVPDN